MMMSTMSTSAAFAKPFMASRPARPAGSRSSFRAPLHVRAAEQPKGGMSDDRSGVLPGLNMWPPKPITESGQPAPEDDPKNFVPEEGNTQGWKRVGGPSEEELVEKRKKQREDSPWSNPNREGGTQRGGGGEGSSA